jgi:hypothetical protein
MFKFVKNNNHDIYYEFIAKKYNIDVETVQQKLEYRLNKNKNILHIDIQELSDFYDVIQSGNHKQLPLTINNWTIDIDENIYDIIEFINKPFNEFITRMSCQHNHFGYARIQFNKQHDFDKWKLYLHKNYIEIFNYIDKNSGKILKYDGIIISLSLEQPEMEYLKILIKKTKEN